MNQWSTEQRRSEPGRVGPMGRAYPAPTSRRGRFGGWRPGVVTLIAVMLLPSMALAVDGSSDHRFLAGLRDRKLFELAAAYCQNRLGDPQLADTDRAELAIELSFTLAEQAVNSPPNQREPLWQRSTQVIDEFVQQFPDSPRLPLVRFQGALALVARGELSRQEAEVISDNAALLQQARDCLRTAIRQLGELHEEVERLVREANTGSHASPQRPQPDQLKAVELVNLQTNVQYQLARALRNQGQCYPAESPDRANSLTQAVRLLDPLAKLDPVHPLAWESRLDEIVCYRLLADDATAQRKLDALLAEKPPPAIQLRAQAERLRLALASNQLPQALGLRAEGRQLDGLTSADLDYAWLEVFLEAWRVTEKAKDQQAAAQWRAKATEMIRLMEQQHGPYWARRAQMLLAGRVEAAADGGDLAMQIHAAESAYRSGRPDDAVAAYDRAQTIASQQENPDRAFELGYIAATIEHQRNRHVEALRRYRQLALTTATHPKAAEAYRLAIFHAAQLAKQQAPGSLQQYEALLHEFLQHWPQTPAANDVRWRLGQLLEQKRNWHHAIAAYQAITPDDPQYPRVVDAATRCYQNWLDERKAAGQATEEQASDAADWFEHLIVGPQGRLPERWSPVAREAALASARLRIDYTPNGFARAERLLAAALAGATDAPAEWKSTALVMLVCALAGQGRHAEADAVLKQLPTSSPDQLLAMLGILERMASTAPVNVRSDLARLQLVAIERLRPERSRLSPAGQRTFDRLQAQALADAGRTTEALDAYQWLAKTYPRDGDIQEAYARLLLVRSDRPSLEQALAKWRDLEEKSKPQSPRWFRAKYHVAELHYRLGNPEQAAKIITLLEVLHPELGGPELRTRFLELQQRCRQ